MTGASGDQSPHLMLRRQAEQTLLGSNGGLGVRPARPPDGAEQHGRHQRGETSAIHAHASTSISLVASPAPRPWLAAVAILITAINIAGGFAVTQRMLGMFRK